MPFDLEATFTLPDDVDPDAFLQALAEFAEEQGVTLAGHSQSREFSAEFKRIGLPTQLNTTLTRLHIFTVAELEGMTVEDLDALKGIGPGSIRQIILALAGDGKALRGEPLIPRDDLIENLDLFPDNYWLLRSRYLRISELTAADRVEVERLEDEIGLSFRLVQQALDRAGLRLS